MNPQNKSLKITGIVLNVLIAATLVFAASGKFRVTEETVKMIKEHGLEQQILLIAIGELVCAVLLLVPWTSPLGVLMTSGFWGGTICLHMSHGEDYSLQSVFLLITWLGGYLRGSVLLLALPAVKRIPGLGS
jgi:uncharacterized membrane protein YphA (DoxX/SURF4 family)